MLIDRSTLGVARTLVLFCLVANPLAGVAQTQPQDPKGERDVLRVFTELVQTDVMVFDKDGEFVNNLQREDFELRIDGKLKPIEFFERITAGTVNEERQLAAARGNSVADHSLNDSTFPLDRGRTIFFFIDDLHMDLPGTALTRKTISKFIENELGQNDEVAITSSSGLIGFLQQLTDNPAVLHKALERLRPRATRVTDSERPLMKEFQALMISRFDRGTIDYFVDAVLRDNPGITRDSAVTMVESRARLILLQGSNITRNTLAGLEGLIRGSSKLPGRKIVFFISNGFLLDSINSDAMERLKRVTSAAARSGVIIYSMDARGLVASLSDISEAPTFDPSGRYDQSLRGELAATQDGMNALARDTGGRPFFNTNSMELGVKKALTETSTYYLLAWKPEPTEEKKSRFRKIEVKLVNRPQLSVRVRRGFFDIEPEPTVAETRKQTTPSKAPPKTSDNGLSEVITAPYPNRGVPVSLSVSHVNTPDKGELLSTSMQVPREFVSFGLDGDNSKAAIEVAGFVYDDRGRVGAKFGERIIISGTDKTSVAENRNNLGDINYNFPIHLNPGLYHVRVGARDQVSGKAGSAQSWIEIPNVAAGQLTASSLLLAERGETIITNAATGGVQDNGEVSLNVSRRFRRQSFLRFLIFIYNPGRGSDGKPDSAVQVQIVRDAQPVLTTALRRISSEGIADLARLPYAAEVPLMDLATGRYLLSVTVVDRITKSSFTQRTKFEVY